ncbi:hypothetical protein DL93DRAFT_2162201 [Clavulina sp. PMI_390]|nr:hypothetical protein DL93DRAFT_2162201 [Clavulina sp. PMI_390]
MKITIIAAVAVLAGSSVVGAIPIYGQCGGLGFIGSTTCDGDLVCVVENEWFFQCLPYSDGETTTSGDSSTTVAYDYYRK